ncbi:glycosyltransferase family 2 protein [Shewanella baltica]|uniref:glycosyltransferase family 2 protein n=1 Tax=Shewanella baltica TaxID=62322 RepID=UPI003D039E95
MHRDLAIIIPVYNDAEGLASVLESIYLSINCINFENDTVEVIIIDDGSNVSYEKTINEFQGHLNINYFKQKNGRQGKARNFGLSKAAADYIWFVDADDEVAITSIDIILKDINKYNNTDLFYYNACCYGLIQKSASPNWNNVQIASAIAENKVVVAPWARIYSRKYLEDINLTYPEYLKYEDLYHSFISTLKCRSHRVLKDCIYKYNYTEGSTTKTHDGSVIDIFNVIEMIESDAEILTKVDKYLLNNLIYVHGVKYTLIRLYQSRSFGLTIKTLINPVFSSYLKKVRIFNPSVKRRTFAKTLEVVCFMVKFLISNKVK